MSKLKDVAKRLDESDKYAFDRKAYETGTGTALGLANELDHIPKHLGKKRRKAYRAIYRMFRLIGGGE